jgi:hypothetical protein
MQRPVAIACATVVPLEPRTAVIRSLFCSAATRAESRKRLGQAGLVFASEPHSGQTMQFRCVGCVLIERVESLLQDLLV